MAASRPLPIPTADMPRRAMTSRAMGGGRESIPVAGRTAYPASPIDPLTTIDRTHRTRAEK